MKDIEGLGLVLKLEGVRQARPERPRNCWVGSRSESTGRMVKTRNQARFSRRLGSAVFTTDDVVAFDDSRNTEAGAAILHTALDANDFA